MIFEVSVLVLCLCSLYLLIYNIVPTVAHAQQDLPPIKHRNLVLDFSQGVKTNAQLTYPVIGNGSFPAVLLISGSGAEDMNETAGFIRIDNKTGEKIYPPVPLYQIAEYLSERGVHAGMTKEEWGQIIQSWMPTYGET